MLSFGGVFHTVPLLKHSASVMQVILEEVFVSRATSKAISDIIIMVDPVCLAHSSWWTYSFI